MDGIYAKYDRLVMENAMCYEDVRSEAVENVAKYLR